MPERDWTMDDVLREAWFWWGRACTREETRKVLLGEDKMFKRMCSAEEFDSVWPEDSRCPKNPTTKSSATT